MNFTRRSKEDLDLALLRDTYSPLDILSHPVSLVGLKQLVKNPAQVYAEFDKMPQYQADTSGLPPGFEQKNRYDDVAPNARSLVTLRQTGGELTKYINANFIRGWGNRMYIATQAPMIHTIEDFWRMVWEQDVGMIAMVTGLVEGGRTKSERYWPTLTEWNEIRAPTTADVDDPSVVIFGEFEIALVKEETYEAYTMTELEVFRDDFPEPRRVVHLWHGSWVDNDAPKNVEPIAEFMLAFRDLRDTVFGPVVVHCNAGIGRTASVLAADILVDQYFEEHTCDVLRTVCLLREDRASSVPLKEQYLLIHRLVISLISKLKKFDRASGGSMYSSSSNESTLDLRYPSLDEDEIMASHRSSLLRGIDINTIPEDHFQITDLEISDDEEEAGETTETAEYGEPPEAGGFQARGFHASEFADEQDMLYEMAEMMDGELIVDPDLGDTFSEEGVRPLNYLQISE